MSQTAMIYALAGVAVFGIGLFGLIAQAHLLRRIIAINVMAGGVFIFFGAMAHRAGGLPAAGARDAGATQTLMAEPPPLPPAVTGADPVPQAMVITGIVVAVSVTAFAITLARRIHLQTGRPRLPRERER